MRAAFASSLLATSLAASALAGCSTDPEPGPYRLVTTAEFTAEAIPPREIEDVVGPLRDFSANPARTMLDLAALRGVPASSVLRAELSVALETRLEGWINAELELAATAGKPITEYADHIAMLAETALTRFAVESELDLDAEPATHRITGIDLRPTGLELRVPIAGIAGDVLTQTPAVSIAESGALSLGDQQFGLAYGEYAWQAIEAASTHVYGGGVRQTLGAAIDCGELARAVAEQCVLGVCVGHEPELREICIGGLDAVVDLAHEKLAAMRLDVLHLAQGEARIDGDRIADGVWQAELDLGAGPRAAPASFSGAR